MQRQSLLSLRDSAATVAMTSAAEADIAASEQALGQLDYDSAYKHFDKATKADPASALAFFGKAEAALGVPKVEPDEIMGLYKKAIELDGRTRSTAMPSPPSASTS